MASHNQKCSDEEFIRLYRECGPSNLARLLGCAIQNTLARRRRLEKQYDMIIRGPGDRSKNPETYGSDHPERRHYTLKNGIFMTISDLHLYPGYIPCACRGFIVLAKILKPKAVCFNGDVLDFPKISRHAPIGWNRKPNVAEEIEVCQEYEHEVRSVAKGADFFWNMGNHDWRLENRIAERNGELDGVEGTRLGDHFPHWDLGISLWTNDTLVTKHRFKGGIHATHNNTLWAGKTMETGHLHSLKVTPLTDYNGTRWGIDTGTGNDPYGPHTDYVEDNPLNHRSGFIVKTFKDGQLLWPEIAAVVDKNHIQFRGEIIKV